MSSELVKSEQSLQVQQTLDYFNKWLVFSSGKKRKYHIPIENELEFNYFELKKHFASVYHTYYSTRDYFVVELELY